ncbi:CCA tRNA nucleotidyltransferase [Phormidium tenue FACHB-886]|nr:CCA tRNA nucleotidyltransferase [Phormidium tenue FACHB-886]
MNQANSFLGAASSPSQGTSPVLDVSALSPQTWPFSLDWLPQTTYLVGGNVRDALLGRSAEYLDLDFVMPAGAVKTAQKMAAHYQAGFVLLDADRQIARVVFENATVDFAQQVGDSLEEDLRRRDFTVNAIAYSPHTEHILDPLQGHADLQQQMIRMVEPDNLKEDPLRLLRAYRQAAQLGFKVDPETQQMIRLLAPLLQSIAPERIQSEVGYLLSTAKGTPFLALAFEDGLLTHWFPHATTTKLSQVAGIDQAAIALAEQQAAFGQELQGWLRDQQKISGTGRSWLKVAKLACLVAEDPAAAEQDLWRLKYSRAEVQAVLSVIRALPQIQSVLSLRDQYHLFRSIGFAFPALAVLAIAQGTTQAPIEALFHRFLTPDDPVAHPVSLVSGRDLMTQLHLRPSPQIGHLLDAIQLARAEGKLHSRADALEFARSQIAAEGIVE